MLPKKKQSQNTGGNEVNVKKKASRPKKNTKRPHSEDSDKMQGYSSGSCDSKASRPSGRRSSTRLQNQKNHKTPGKPFLVDSAYDGDEESSPSATPSEEDDPYSVATMEDVPAVSRERKKKQQKRLAVKQQKSKVKKRASSAGGHISSTPNQVVQLPVRRSTRNSPHLNITPQVTPILPVESKDTVSLDTSFTTPQIHPLTNKQSPLISSASPSIQSSSQADSGIALSPPAKRARIQEGELRHKSAAVLGKKFMNKRNIFSPNPKEKGSESEAKENMDSSCFGFSSVELSGKDQSEALPIKGIYRSAQPLTTDSSPTSPSRPLMSTDSENCTNSHHWHSPPGLFSDDVISADSESMTFNKSSARSYKPSKVKKLKHKKSVSKFEAWANEKNMEIEDIEKFDLNIE